MQKPAGSKPPPRRSRPIRRLIITCLSLGALLLLLASPAPAQTGESSGRPLHVVEVSGLIDPIVADFVTDSIATAEAVDAEALVIQLNSPGSVLDQARLDALTTAISGAEVTVAIWIGPNRAKALGGAGDLIRAAPVTGMARRTRLEDRSRRLGSDEALAADLIDLDAPTLGDFVVGLDELNVRGRRLETADVEQTDAGPRRRPNVQVSFAKLGLLPRLLHTVASPPVAYLLLLVGLLLVVFEFFTVGIGVAAAVGAGCLILSGYGLDVLPTRPIGVALLALAIAGYAIDVQVGVPRVWTGIGSVALVLGSLNFYRGLSPGWVAMVVAVAGVPLFMVAAMPGVIRSRFSTPTIGRESMVGEEGTAVAAVAPDGVVRVRDGLWRARTNRATPIAGGGRVRVVAVDGLVLEVEPEEGGARDAHH